MGRESSRKTCKMDSIEDSGEEDDRNNVTELSTRLDSIKLYPYRWFILLLYSLTAFSNTLVWLSLFTVSDATSVYYQVSAAKIIWSSTAFTALQVIIAVPVTFLPSRLGLRTTMVLASVINAIGACIMIASTHRGGFPYFIAGQTVIAIAASILPQLAPHVSAVWFGEKEHAFSTSVGIIIGNAGAAVGFLQPALMISNINPKEHIPYIDLKLKELIYSQAALCVVLLFLVVLFFKTKPLFPPTLSEAIRTKHKVVTISSFKQVYKTLLKDRHYLIAGNAFAINNVLLITVPVFLNSIVSWKFPYRDAVIGWMGFGGIIAGIIGSIVFSLILDKTQSHQKMAALLGISSLILWIAFTESLAYWSNLAAVATFFVMCIFTFIPFGPVVVDMMTEMTYPISESMSFVLPITAGRFYNIPVIFVLGYLEDQGNYHLVCWIIAGILALSVVFVVIPKVQMKRTEAGQRTLDAELNLSEESLLQDTSREDDGLDDRDI